MKRYKSQAYFNYTREERALFDAGIPSHYLAPSAWECRDYTKGVIPKWVSAKKQKTVLAMVCEDLPNMIPNLFVMHSNNDVGAAWFCAAEIAHAAFRKNRSCRVLAISDIAKITLDESPAVLILHTMTETSNIDILRDFIHVHDASMIIVIASFESSQEDVHVQTRRMLRMKFDYLFSCTTGDE